MDENVEIEGYDGPVDDSPAYTPSPGRRSAPDPGRRGGKKTLSPSAGPRHSRPIGRRMGFRLGFSPRALARSASSLLMLAVIGVIAIAFILVLTFTTYPGSGPDDQIKQFYGSILASAVVVLLLSYVVVKLLGSD